MLHQTLRHLVPTFFIADEFKAKLNKANLNLISPQDLDKFVSGTVYLVGCQLTLADIMLYYALHPVMTELSIQEKEQLVNLSRWFNQVNLTITRIYLVILITLLCTVESQIFKPLRETIIGSENWVVQEIGSKITVLN